MTKVVEINTLAEGDLVDVGPNKKSYTVLGNYGDRVVAACHILVMNPIEWLRNGRHIIDVSSLNVGDKITNAASNNEYVVTSIHGRRVIVMHSVFLSGPQKCILKANSSYEMI